VGQYHRTEEISSVISSNEQKGIRKMYQFFVESGQIGKDSVMIEGSDVNHIKNVLRMKPGEKIRISGPAWENYFCEIAEIEDSFVRASILEKDETGTELPNRIYLFQGLPKNDKMELIIQKAVELGVYEIIPVAMKNCVVKLDAKKAAAKTARWQGIAESAAKQSKRSLIPKVSEPVSYKEAVAYAMKLDQKLVPYENERGMAATREAVEAVRPGESIGIFIGPEGGFAPEEIEAVKGEMKLISLGSRILRTETAGFTTLAILMYHIETSCPEKSN
jgi:RNA methyltransferase, rsmE family